VLDLPDDAKLFARNEFCPLAGFTVGNHTMTIQGHPEFNHQYANDLMTFRRELLGSECFDAGLASLSQDTDHQVMGRWLVNFFRSSEVWEN
jgi:GMP synthase-like glutamine amidotransferase